jgi:hypothetical protein
MLKFVSAQRNRLLKPLVLSTTQLGYKIHPLTLKVHPLPSLKVLHGTSKPKHEHY